MLAEIQRYFLFMMAISILGWGMEVACKYMEFHRFINRGFLIGPYCPIYGVGAVLIVLFLSPYSDAPLTVFLLGMVLCGTLEYLTSSLMEKLFHARWWDYSQRRFNLNGRICANTLIPFGRLGLALIYLIQPLLFGWFNRLSALALNLVSSILLALFLSDIVISSTVLAKIRASASASGADDTEMLTRAVREELSKHHVLVRRTLRAFPYLKLYNSRLLKQMKEKQQEIKRETAAYRRKVREELDSHEQRLRQFYDEKRHEKAERKKAK